MSGLLVAPAIGLGSTTRSPTSNGTVGMNLRLSGTSSSEWAFTSWDNLIDVPSMTGTGSIVLSFGPTLSNPIVGTQSPGDNSTKAASTAYVAAAVSSSSYTLPAASPSALGGVNSIAAVSHQWINSINTAGLPILSQPSFSDISGLGSMAQQSSASVAITGASITGLSSPVNPSDAATKFYVDSVASALSPKSACVVASTANLTAIYNNGTSGVGATLTNSGTQVALTIDGVAVPLNVRVLIKDQSSPAQNGIFSLNNQGSGSSNWQLTRTTDFDGSGGGPISAGAYVVIQLGTANTGTLWIETGPGPFTVGTTAITFTKLSAASQTLSLTGDVTGTGSVSIATTVTQINGVSLGSTTATSGHLLIANGTTWTSQSLGGDGTLSGSGSLTVTKTNGANFTTAATTAIGTSGGTIPLLNSENTWSAQQDFHSGVSLNSGQSLLLNGSADQNWRVGLGINAYSVATVGSATSIQFVYGSGSSGPDGMAFGPTGGSSTLELRGDDNSAYFRGPVRMANYSAGVAQFDGSGNLSSGSYAPVASTLLGTVLASNVVTSSLTTVGTIGTGTWHASIVAGQYGGTGVANTGLTLALSANNAVGSWTVTGTGSASTSPAQITGAIFTGTNATPQLLISPTGTTLTFPWNIAGTVLGANVASGYVGDYINFRRSGVTTPDFNVNASGVTYGGNLISKQTFTQFNDSVGVGVLSFDANYLWGLRNGTNANELRVYGTYASGASYERLVMRTASGNYTIGTESAGAGVARGLNITTAETTAIAIDSSQNVSVTNLAASHPVGTDSSNNLTSLSVTGTGAVVLASGPTLSNPIVGTQSPSDNSNKAASTAFVATALSSSGYMLPTASTVTLGGVKVDGSTITINDSGVISSSGGAGTVTNLSVVGNDGITQSITNPMTTPQITLGLGNITPTSVSTGTATLTGALALKNGGNANILNLQAGVTASTITFTLPTADGTAGQTLVTDGAQNWSFGTLSVAGGGTGAVTLTGLVKGNGTSAFTPATVGTDYSAGTQALATGILKSTTATGVLTIAIASDFPTLNQNTTGNAATVTTNANLTGVVTSVGNATSLGSFTSANLAAALTDETGTGSAVFATSPTLITPLLGTPTSGNLANCTFPTLNQNTTGNADTVTTNANMSGVVTSVGNTTSFGSFTSATFATALSDETGSGSVVFSASPTFTGTAVFANITAGSTSAINFNSRTALRSSADGVLNLANNAGIGFTGVQYASPTAANTAGSSVGFTGSLSTGIGIAGTQTIANSFAGVSASATVTVTIANPAVFSLTAHGFIPGQSFTLTTTGALPTGLATATTYYVIATGLAVNTFQASASPAGSAIVTTGSQSGTHTLTSTTTVQNPAVTIATWGPSGLTGSQTTPILSLATTWNTSGIANGILLNVTNIAASSSSNLLNLQVGGSSVFAVSLAGTVVSSSTITGTTLVANNWNNSNNTVTIWQGAASSNNATFMVTATSPIMRFAGSTSSFPAIKRSSTTLAFRLADDSADCAITVGAATFSGTVNNTTLTASVPLGTDGSKNLVSLTATGTGNVVLATSPTLSNPVVGTQAASDNSTLAASTAYVTSAVNSALTSLDSKPDVAYASTSALPSNTYSNGTAGVGATLTGTANGPLIVDGVTILLSQVGERILVAGESTQANNGWYTITQQGTVAVSPYILTRAVESDQAAEIGAGYLTGVVAPNSVTPGSNNGKVFISVANDPFTVGTTALTFSQVGSTYSAGTGLTLSGSTFSVNASQTQVTALGTVVTGTWNATTIAVANGGTGATTLTGVLKGNGTSAFTAATAGTDYVAPGTITAFTAQQYFTEQTLTDASTITWNANTQQSAFVLLTSAVGSTRIMGFPSNIQAGATYTLVVKQSSTGSNAITYGSGYLFPGGTAFVLSTANNAIDVLTFVCHGSNLLGVGQKAFA